MLFAFQILQNNGFFPSESGITPDMKEGAYLQKMVNQDDSVFHYNFHREHQMIVIVCKLFSVLFLGEKLSQIGSILLHLLQLVQCNAQRITMVKNPTEYEDLKLDAIGMGND